MRRKIGHMPIIIIIVASVSLTNFGVIGGDDDSEYHVNVTNVDMNGQGNSISVSPGASITISLDYEIWSNSGCPGCIDQIVVGIENTPKYCAYNNIPGSYPGETGSNTHTITAPTAPGIYYLKWTKHMEYSCSDAMAGYNDGRTKTIIGTITVIDGDNHEDNLVACWHFDEGGGSTVYDSSGNNNHGTIHGTNWTSGVSGNALDFDGVDDYVSLPVGPTTGLETPYVSVEAWVYLNNNENRQVIFAYRPACSGNLGLGYMLQVDVKGTVSFSIGNGSPPYKYTKSDTTLELNRWYHVVGSYDGNYINVSVNGELEGSYTISTSIDYTDRCTSDPPYKNCIIGSLIRYSGGYYHFFDGILDEVRVYNRALSISEIQAHYKEYMDGGENTPPTVDITHPRNGDILSGIVTITGTASDVDLGDNVEWVEVRIDDTNWVTADGTTTWSRDFYSTGVKDDSHTIYARSYDGTDYSQIVSITVIVDNIPDEDPILEWTKKYTPKLWFHYNEEYHPTYVDAMIEDAYVVRSGDWKHYQMNDRDYLSRQDADYAMYIRIVENDIYDRPSGRIYCTTLQYWFFYIYNSWLNSHEGDWELVELIWLKDDLDYIIENELNPDYVVCSKHGWNERREWKDVEKDEETHPVIFVAKGSHANYFDEGTEFIKGMVTVEGVQTFTISEIKHYFVALTLYNIIKTFFENNDWPYGGTVAVFCAGVAEKLLEPWILKSFGAGDITKEVVNIISDHIKNEITKLIGEWIADFLAGRIINQLIDVVAVEVQLIVGQALQILQMLNIVDYDALETTAQGKDISYNNYDYILIDGNEEWMKFDGRWGSTFDVGGILISPLSPKYQGFKWSEPANWGLIGKGTDFLATEVGVELDYGEIACIAGDKIIQGLQEYCDNVWNNVVCFKLLCPASLHIYDEYGNHNGINSLGNIEAEIPESICLEYHNETIALILNATQNYNFEVAGTGRGIYNLTVVKIADNIEMSFNASDIPTNKGSIHRYNINWSEIGQSQNGVTIKFDNDGNGEFEKETVADSDFTLNEYNSVVESRGNGISSFEITILFVALVGVLLLKKKKK